MFNIPKWEDDVPNTILNFGKIKHHKKNKKSNGVTQSKAKLKQKIKAVTSKRPLNVKSNFNHKLLNNAPSVKVNKPKFSNDNKKRNDKEHTNKTKVKKPDREVEFDFSSEVQDFDTNKTDEVILNFKKKKLNDDLRKDDVEDLLFSEKSFLMTPTEKNLTIINESGSSEKIIKHRKESLPRKKKIQNDINTNSNSSKVSQNRVHFVEEEKSNKCNIENIYKNNKTSGNKIKTVTKTKNRNILDFNINPKKEKLKKMLDTLILPKHSLNTNTNNHLNIKKEKLKRILETSNLQRNSITTSGNKLRERMLERLKSAQFRYLNEQLYTSSGSDAQELFRADPTSFQIYHQGYQQQVKKWPVNPLNIIINRIQKLPKSHLIADMGCGEGMLSQKVPQVVRSFDLVACSPGVEVCDIAHTPLLTASVDVVVYCLALMGTNLTQYLVEANRVLKMGGLLLIAEVESRFDKVDDFTRSVQQLGFNLKKLDNSHKVFFFMEFTKVRDPPAKKSKIPMLTLKPCVYKKR